MGNSYRKRLLAFASIFVVATSTCTWATSAFADPPGENQNDSTGSRAFLSEPSAELQAIDQKLREALRNSGEMLLGTAFTSDGTMIEVHGESATSELRSVVQGALSHREMTFVRFVDSNFSISDFNRSAAEVLETRTDSGELVGIGLDVATQTAIVTIDTDPTGSISGLSVPDGEQITPDSRGLSTDTSELMREVEATTPLPVKFTSGELSVSAENMRYPNTPLPGGGQIRSAPDYISVCSMSVPLKVNGETMMLTAGHCVGSSFRTTGASGTFVGNTYTTSYSTSGSGTLESYGDFRLLRGGSYAKQVLMGPVSTAHREPYGAADFLLPSQGTLVLTSGRTTGTNGNYLVRRPTQLSNVNYGTEENPIIKRVRMTEMVLPSPDNPLEYTCDGFRKGDSGGAVFRFRASGGMIASGNVTAFDGVDKTTNCQYYYSPLAYLLDWNSGVSF
ncbi:hypothetical protein [Brachybacterium phenoliresistens]|uniref:hypothetical protein n=1 Tax=Brachybacterium phenoliresistens TaxID=396014 RepID=UPI0031D7D946